MKIAIASGKGGTGKTLVATNLAYSLARNGNEVLYLDCDVEEPNAHLFFNLEEHRRQAVAVPVPRVDTGACDLCGTCGEFCEYGAIVTAGAKVLIFPELCHGCGGCSLLCPRDAIQETPHGIGEVIDTVSLEYPGLNIRYGLLKLGEAMALPVIKEVKRNPLAADCVILDSPPGTSCPVIETVKGSDYVVLVTEPTPFGMNDLELAVGMVRKLGLPFGVVINQVGLGDDRIHRYCARDNIPILLELPYSRAIAEMYSRGIVFTTRLTEYEPMLMGLFDSIAAGNA